MGGHAADGAGRALDGPARPHEGELVRADSPGEEGRYVEKAFLDLWSICGSARGKKGCGGVRLLSAGLSNMKFGASVNGVIRQLVLPEQLLVMSLGPVRVGPLS